MLVNGHCGHLQWQIQDFSEGAPNPKVGVLTFFCRKLHEIELI